MYKYYILIFYSYSIKYINTHFEVNDAADIEKKRAYASFASALATNVLPVPGGLYNIMYNIYI